MHIVWSVVLSLLLCGWFALDGFVLGAGMVTFWATDARGRRQARTAVGPFLLASEMWLIAAAGVTVGIFSTLEPVLRGSYPIITLMLVSWMLRDAALWLGRRTGTGRAWDWVWVIASVVFAGCAGLLLGTLAHGLPLADEAPLSTMFGPVSLLCALTVIAVLAQQGCAFLMLRLPESARGRAAALLPRLTVAAVVTTAAAVIAGLLDHGVRHALSPVALPFVALEVLASALALTRHRAGRRGQAFACTTVAAVALPVAIGAGLHGPLSAVTVSSGGLAVIAVPVLPLIVAHQVWLWWLFRRPVTRDSAVFF